MSSQRQAARFLDMRPSSIFYWRQTGKLGPAPWTLNELLAVKDRADAPRRRRGVTTAHGSLSRAGAGCNGHDCRAAGAAFQRERDRRQAETQFPPNARAALLDLLDQGVPFKQALIRIGVRAQPGLGSCPFRSRVGAQLQATIDQARPAHINHGRQSSYRLGCRCSECRANAKGLGRMHRARALPT
jgi:hypothetical protein